MALIRSAALLILAATIAAPRLAQAGEPEKQMAAATETPSPDFDRLKALAGEWEGTARHGGDPKAMPTRASIKVVSAGSAVMLVTDPGTPHEMVTMFHRDGDALLATHYCSAMNQPRMKARAGSPAGSLAFEFMDGTNLGPHPGRMQGLVVSMPDAGHHSQVWTFRAGGQDSTMTFDMKRAKGS
jgi:hypothetical protein